MSVAATTGHLRAVLAHLPPVQFAMAYGSGVFRQAGYDAADKPQLDLVLGVEDARGWHADNLQRNRQHYSLLGALGAGAVAAVQERGGARLYYHPFVDMAGEKVKYGVISLRDLAADLRDWPTLYVSGRMHKPTAVLETTPALVALQAANLEAALRAALLLLPPAFEPRDLFDAVAALSYSGDLRFAVGAESPSKVGDIVSANEEGFAELYAGAVRGCRWLEGGGGGAADVRGDVLRQTLAPGSTAELVDALPAALRSALQPPPGQPPWGEHPDEREALAGRVRAQLGAIVRWSSATQSAKGLLTAGTRSTDYLAAKLSKAAKGKSRLLAEERRRGGNAGNGPAR